MRSCFPTLALMLCLSAWPARAAQKPDCSEIVKEAAMAQEIDVRRVELAQLLIDSETPGIAASQLEADYEDRLGKFYDGLRAHEGYAGDKDQLRAEIAQLARSLQLGHREAQETQRGKVEKQRKAEESRFFDVRAVNTGEGREVRTVLAGGDGESLYMVDRFGQLIIGRSDSDSVTTKVATNSMGRGGRILHLLESPNGERLYFFGEGGVAGYVLLKERDFPLVALSIGDMHVAGASFSPDGKTLYVVGDGAEIVAFDANTPQRPKAFFPKDFFLESSERSSQTADDQIARVLEVSSKGSSIQLITEKGKVKTLALDGDRMGVEISSFELPRSFKNYAQTIAQTVGDKVFFAGPNDALAIVDPVSREAQPTPRGFRKLEGSPQTGALALSPFRQLLFIGKGHTLVVADVKNPEKPNFRVFKLQKRFAHLYTHSLSVSPDERVLYIAGAETGAALFNTVSEWRIDWILEQIDSQPGQDN